MGVPQERTAGQGFVPGGLGHRLGTLHVRGFFSELGSKCCQGLWVAGGDRISRVRLVGVGLLLRGGRMDRGPSTVRTVKTEKHQEEQKFSEIGVVATE